MCQSGVTRLSNFEGSFKCSLEMRPSLTNDEKSTQKSFAAHYYVGQTIPFDNAFVKALPSKDATPEGC